MIKTPEQRQWCRSVAFIVNFEYILHLVVKFLLLTLNIIASWDNLAEGISNYTDKLS